MKTDADISINASVKIMLAILVRKNIITFEQAGEIRSRLINGSKKKFIDFYTIEELVGLLK